MRRTVTLSAILATAVVVAPSGSTQSTPQPPPTQAPPAAPSATLSPDLHYRLGPDSLAQEGVPRGEVRGPFTLPSQAYPGTQHTYWVYVPAQYDASRPASLMIFNDGQAFKNMEGDLRVPNVLDNLIHRREMPVMIGGVHQPGPDARTAGADAAGLGRPHDEPPDRVQLAGRHATPASSSTS